MGICETIKMITREEGTEIGREEEKMDFVKSILLDTDFNDQIAKICKVEESEVKKMRQDPGL